MRKLIPTLTLVAALALPTVGLTADLQAAGDAIEQGDYATAMELYRDAAAEGDMLAAEALGVMHWYGEALFGPTTPVNTAAALLWFTRAAAQGSEYGKYMITVIAQAGMAGPAIAAGELRGIR
jgi:TPR repeat protein